MYTQINEKRVLKCVQQKLALLKNIYEYTYTYIYTRIYTYIIRF